MGREAICRCRVDTEEAEVKALLESTEIVLRGTIRRRFPLTTLQALRVNGGRLLFSVDGAAVELALGEAEAQAWLRKLQAPPRSLADKLGVSVARPVFVIGAVTDALLTDALHGAQTRDPGAAAVALAQVRSAADLDATIAAHRDLACPLWIVHPKGRDANPSDAQVRQALRALGYADSKTSAVSDAFTATRYARR